MLEIHVNVAATDGFTRDDVSPAADILRRIAFVAQTEIGVVGGDLYWCRQLLAVGDAQRQVAGALGIDPAGAATGPSDRAGLHQQGNCHPTVRL